MTCLWRFPARAEYIPHAAPIVRRYRITSRAGSANTLAPSTFSPPDTTNAPRGRQSVARRGSVRPIHGAHPSALRAAGPAMRPSKFVPDESVFAPSMGLTPPRCALRGRPCGRPNSFQTNRCSPHPWGSPLRAARCGAGPAAVQIRSRRICHRGGRMPERTSAQPMARRAKGGRPESTGVFCEHAGSLSPLSPPDTKNAPLGGVFRIWRRERDSNPR